MAVISYKCPNCGGELVFDPKSGEYKCPYCTSTFPIDHIEQGEETEKQAEDKTEAKAADETAGETGQAVVYTCPSCGAEIVTDETTAATFCFYCHNPVVLSGRLSGKYLPDQVIPFAIDKKEAVNKFMDFVGKKKFVPRAFFSKDQIEKMSGVYFPFWSYTCDLDGQLEGEGRRLRIWRTGEQEFTETSIYRVTRRGKLHFPNVTKNALNKADKLLVEGVQPFNMDGLEDFHMGYLSGFQAEKRDQEQSEFTEMLRGDTEGYTKRMLENTVDGYSSCAPSRTEALNRKEQWRYVLLPVWVLTYKGKNGKIYYYSCNGQTGKVFGELPVDYGRVAAAAGIVGLLVLILCLIGGYLL